MNMNAVQTFRAVMSDRGHPLSEWSDAVAVVWFALNSSYRKWMGVSPFQLMTERVQRMTFSVLAGNGSD